MISRFAHFRHQTLDVGDFGAVCGNRDGDGAGPFGWQGIERLTGRFACCGFAGGDVDFGTAGLEEAARLISVMVHILARCSTPNTCKINTERGMAKASRGTKRKQEELEPRCSVEP